MRRARLKQAKSTGIAFQKKILQPELLSNLVFLIEENNYRKLTII